MYVLQYICTFPKLPPHPHLSSPLSGGRRSRGCNWGGSGSRLRADGLVAEEMLRLLGQGSRDNDQTGRRSGTSTWTVVFGECGDVGKRSTGDKVCSIWVSCLTSDEAHDRTGNSPLSTRRGPAETRVAAAKTLRAAKNFMLDAGGLDLR